MEFGDDFGQVVDLCARVREVLRGYPEGSSVIKEIVQNADDATASTVVLCLDLRRHGDGVPSSMAGFQGPSLLAYNSGVFTETDFASIQRIGDSLKRDTSRGVKAGRFGLGFNSLYHLTELPSFVSADRIVWFDPSASYLPGVNPANPGKAVFFGSPAGKETLARFPDMFAPLQVRPLPPSLFFFILSFSSLALSPRCTLGSLLH